MAISTQEQRNAWIEYVADGSVTDFPIPFGFLHEDHLVVKDDGATVDLVDDYVVIDNDDGIGPIVRFGTAPTTAHVVLIKRVTPETLYQPDPVMGHIQAIQAFYLAQERADIPVVVKFVIPATELAAGTAIDAYSPVEGEIIRARAVVQTAIGTGGDITVKVGTTAVDGLTLTIANSATKGTIVSDRPTAGHASTKVNKGSRLQVVPAAAFDTAGAVDVWVEIKPGAGV